MTNEEFEAIVQRREIEAAANPASYRNRVLWLGVLGYGYIILLLLGTLALIGFLVALVFLARSGGAIALKGIFVLGAFAIVILRALWVTFPKPDGIALTKHTAPELWSTVNRLREKMDAPAFHQILLTSDYNAAVVQRPLLGIFGWQQNYLLVGLPLLYTLTKDQFDSVIAHEMGHLRGGHGKFSSWVYRVNATWGQLLERLEEGGGANAIVSGFFKWYAPQFAAYSFPLRRQNEYEADRAAAEAVGRKPAADALGLISVWEGYLGRTFWKPFYKSVHDHPSPPSNPFSQLMAHPLGPALEGDSRSEAERSLSDALREETTFADSHPALVDRLKSLGADVEIPEFAPRETAMYVYLSRSVDSLVKRLDKEFAENIAPSWAEKYGEAQQEKKELALLSARLQKGEVFTPEDAWKYAYLILEYRSAEEALPLYQEIAEREDVRPLKNGLLTAGALLQVGKLLLNKRDPAAVGYIKAAMDTSSQVKSSGLSMLYGYYRMTGDNEAARNVYVEALRHSDLQNAASEERSELLGSKVRYLPHGLDYEQIAPLVGEIRAIEKLGDAYLVRKEVTHFADKPVFIFAFTLKDEWKSLQLQTDQNKLCEAVSEALNKTLPDLIETLPPGTQWSVIPLFKENKANSKSFAKIEGACIVTASRGRK